MLKKEITSITRLSQYKKELKSTADISLTIFAPDTNTSFAIEDQAVLFGKNIKEIIDNINRHDDLNWYNFIRASSDSVNVPEDVYAMLYFADTYFIIKFVIREVRTWCYKMNADKKYDIIYESSEIYYTPHFEKVMYQNYYAIREAVKFFQKLPNQ